MTQVEPRIVTSDRARRARLLRVLFTQRSRNDWRPSRVGICFQSSKNLPRRIAQGLMAHEAAGRSGGHF